MSSVQSVAYDLEFYIHLPFVDDHWICLPLLYGMCLNLSSLLPIANI
uniref:Uncharacterized protein n=1 Tax=Rhizophora mucronata TaxID=61149 RepID=A0A2P2Q9I7_RHIMU